MNLKPLNVTLLWSGDKPLSLPAAGPYPKRALKPDEPTTVPMEHFHAVGGLPEMSEHLGAGRLRAVCAGHRFLEGEEVCANCHVTRVQAEEERAQASAAAASAKAARASKPAAP